MPDARPRVPGRRHRPGRHPGVPGEKAVAAGSRRWTSCSPRTRTAPPGAGTPTGCTRLGELTAPAVPGELRPATDEAVVADWYGAFADAVGEPRGPDARAVTARVVAQRRLFFWTVGGEPVCLVGHSPTVAGVARIGPVWTPPGHRRHGYASAGTAAVAARLRPAEVVLFADVADPTATGVYTRLGFRPVGERGEWRLEY